MIATEYNYTHATTPLIITLRKNGGYIPRGLGSRLFSVGGQAGRQANFTIERVLLNLINTPGAVYFIQTSGSAVSSIYCKTLPLCCTYVSESLVSKITFILPLAICMRKSNYQREAECNISSQKWFHCCLNTYIVIIVYNADAI